MMRYYYLVFLRKNIRQNNRTLSTAAQTTTSSSMMMYPSKKHGLQHQQYYYHHCQSHCSFSHYNNNNDYYFNHYQQQRPKNESRFFSTTAATINNDDGRRPITKQLEKMIANGTVQPDDHQTKAAAELDRLYLRLEKHGLPTKTTTTTTATTSTTKNQSSESSSSFFGRLFGSSNTKSSTSSASATTTNNSNNLNSKAQSIVPGAYMYGGVGCGKTFLMNLFYDSINGKNNNNNNNNNNNSNYTHPWKGETQKVHYHKFMLQVHQHMHEARKVNPTGDLIQPVVQAVLKQGRLLCLDEFQVTDVADALILQRLFTGLWEHGCVLVATSNRPPKDLYLHGLQRDRFLPFIALLEQNCSIVDLTASETDYRMLSSHDDAFLTSQQQQQQPASSSSSPTQAVSSTSSSSSSALKNGSSAGGQKSQQQQQQQQQQSHQQQRLPQTRQVYFSKGQHITYRELYFTLTENQPSNPTQLETQGRKVKIPLACPKRGIAKFTFEDLCCKALGAADYLVIGSHFSTVFCSDIPKMTIHHLNWLRRFITFVDTMYELKVTLILHTNAESIHDIFVLPGNNTNTTTTTNNNIGKSTAKTTKANNSSNTKEEYSQDEVFAFDRTRSRLQEMSSVKYLTSPWEGDPVQADKVTKRKIAVLPIPSVSTEYGQQLSHQQQQVILPPQLPKLRATPMRVNQID